ncbi:cytochrome ubiquinol oxidase subunit I [Natronoglycomyces albus]|uniref:Cytochrome ubiquinol oxidase subunit I n=1 Tax=Natronoglycomyces albus TaxID=2811108 RepID=A0A895XLV7_9ACTN|nr:cytochrome ubiquinol oxidase subunit I [Natronoglycomyces albus]QSB06671.1 cytochrome ubiquinol oxidase subunit I [Natronoglycomyces albus]
MEFDLTALDPVTLARWQFGITTVYHFLMVPLTIGLGLTVAIMQTLWHRTGNEVYLRMTKFWGKLFLINVILGIATGLVQEFQFGLSWSEYSRFVGDVFGSLLALEALLAFFLESTFLGLWIFGWGRLPKRVHLATIWAAAIGAIVSAYFIIAANSWMQHPVGIEFVDGRPVLNDVGAVLTNSTTLAAFPHAIFGSFAVAGAFLVGISWYHLHRHHRMRLDDDVDRAVWRKSLKAGAWVSLAAFIGLVFTGDVQAKLMFEQQPMKMAAAEALCETEQPASFSIFAIGEIQVEDCEDITSITVPGLLSFLAEGDFESEVRGIRDLEEYYQEEYGATYPDDEWLGDRAGQPIDYVPNLPVTYWGFRVMIGFGAMSAALSLAALWLTRGDRLPSSRWLMRAAVGGIALPFIANAAGWIFTEMGRQPFVVVPNPDPDGVEGVFFYTVQAVSPHMSGGEVLTSLISLTLIYGALAVVEIALITKYVRAGTPGVMPDQDDSDDEPSEEKKDVLSFAY